MRLVWLALIRKMTRVFKTWYLAMTVAAAAALSGCESGTHQSTTVFPANVKVVSVPVLVTPPAPVKVLPPPVAHDIISKPLPVVPPPALTNATPAPAPKPAWPSNWVNSWVPLESWGQFNGLERPRQLTSGADASYQIFSSNGTFRVQMGSHTLRVGGMDFWLGYAPRAIKGLPYIHSVDGRKTLQPLIDPLLPWPRTNRTIVIDAGHGGKDGGTRSGINNEFEKHYTLDWARRVERLLTAQGWKVVLTRSNDTAVSLQDRVAIAELSKADLFLSLHFNHGPGNDDLAGVETYCLTPTGMPSSINRGYGDDIGAWHPNNAFDDQNFRLAAVLHRAVLATAGAADRGVCRARFLGVLRGQNRPAVLIEGGYLSNPREARKIATSTYRQTLAEGIAKALE
ncbi:MAG: N-acetylmuramoyl-L-alanine amidase [Verrucomicrobiota bacterium]|jgi:N-acetylmuramoyl-L-alanine amidase